MEKYNFKELEKSIKYKLQSPVVSIGFVLRNEMAAKTLGEYYGIKCNDFSSKTDVLLMNFKENKHYANEYGVELNEYLKHNFNYEELAGWYTMQVLKYLVRAGKKEGESYDKDRNKALDYAKELANLSNENELTEYTTDDIMGFIQELADDFERWEGIK